ncbi:medium chain dehydrogenase/reductase family protein [Streptomyces sp. MN03-5084-2B]|nr:medium chain dehydrogenase/reductase family protein [Streptomyces sp. MN03-5084-2B]
MNVTEIVLPGLVEPDGLRVEHRELPPPAADEALIRVEASGISFAEQQMRRGKYYDQPPFPFVPGYDVVGTVLEAEDPALIGRRVAAMTKIGGWSSHLAVPAGDLVPVPDGLDPGEAETFVVNGITAYQMLHRWAKVRPGGTILVHGASGGVGSTLVQLARAAGITVIGTASARNLDVVTALGATALDYRGDVPAQVRVLAPQGVDAVFDHVGGPGIVDSFRLLAPGGALLAYGSASTVNTGGNPKPAVLKLLVRLLWWNAVPNRRRAHFYNVWGGKRNLQRFRARLAADLAAVFDLAAQGKLKAQVAARVPLTEAAKALALAESGTVTGKVVLVP